MNDLLSNDIVVTREAVDSGDPYDLVFSNIKTINSLLQRHVQGSEINADAMHSYYVDYFLAQLDNGGFSQFIYNSGPSDTVAYAKNGLALIGAHRHLALFEHAEAQLESQLGSEGLARFLASDYWGDNPDRDLLEQFTDGFYALKDIEDLVQLNASWLRAHPNLRVVPASELGSELDAIAAAIPDLDERVAAARAREPRYTKLIRALCEDAGHELDRVTAGDPTATYNGESILSWHFLTDQGHYRMIDLGETAIMFVGRTDEVVTQITTGDRRSAPPL